MAFRCLQCMSIHMAIHVHVRGPLPARRFFTLVLLLFLLHSMGLSLFRFQGSLCRDENIASTGGAFLFLVMLLLGGFLLSKNDIPDWWIWFYWMVRALLHVPVRC